MDISKRKELEEKRKALQAELKLQSLRNEIASQIAIAERLCQPYHVYFDAENFNWLITNVKIRRRDGYKGMHGDFQIDVDDTFSKESCSINEEQINTNVFKDFFTSFISLDASLLICYQNVRAELEISTLTFLSDPLQFFNNPETWIISKDKKWVVEYLWLQGIIRFIQIDGSTPKLMLMLEIEYCLN